MRLFAFCVLLIFLFLPLTLLGQTVRFETSLGNIDVQLLPNDAPKTVANFLAYLQANAYANSFIHRSVPNFVIQGGGYQWSDTNGPVPITENAAVVNEFKISNTRGTLAMAKLGNDPNSATSQWYFNQADNSSNLDSSNGGFTVFGRVANDAGLAVMDLIASQPTYDASTFFGSADFTDLPLVNYNGSFTAQNLVLITAILVVPGIASNAIIAPGDFGGAATVTAGSYLEIYGTNLAGTTRTWRTSDFSNGNAPTTVDKVSVTVNGTPAYVSFVSPAQVNIEVPAGIPTGTAPVVLTYNGNASALINVTVKGDGAAILAPTSFKISGKQFVGAYHVNGAPVNNGQIHAFPTAPANPGETLLFYGLGFGPVQSGAAIAGKIATGQTTLSNPVKFLFGDNKKEGTVLYQGLAPNFVGLYQFNVTVPPDAASGDLALQVSQNGNALPQTLYVSVK